MQQQCVIAEFESVSKARVALEVLAKGGYGEDQVSFVARTDAPELKEIGKLEEGAAHNIGSASGAGLGGLLGGALSAPVAASTLIGPFILVGPLVGVGLGAAIGGLLAGAQDWGVHRDAGEEYEHAVKHGSVLVVFSSADDAELRDVENSLKTTGPISLRRFARPEAADA